MTAQEGHRVSCSRLRGHRRRLTIPGASAPSAAQGATSDTAHLILADHATREGSYVAITRARQTTHIHASWAELTALPEGEPIEQLGTLLGASEPDLPSIATALAHEQQLDRVPSPQPTRTRSLWVRRKTPAHEIDDLGWEL